MGYTKSAKNSKPPTLSTEFAFVSLNLFFLKFYSEVAFSALSFFTVLLPLMAYAILTLFSYLLKFIQFMQIEDDEEGSSILTTKQRSLLSKILRNLLTYFGFYFLSGVLDKHLGL